jgi:16S rRNA (uracil1498-N3)-methyltransferase
MALPIFYVEQIQPSDSTCVLNEDTSKHIVQVLRMNSGDSLQLTDGKGNIFTARIIDNNRKKCVVEIVAVEYTGTKERSVIVAISLVKNNTRFEWFLEKATEIGVCEIVPLICERTEKQQFKQERMKNILVSAMLQSQQSWLPDLHEPIRFNEFIKSSDATQKFIAHCEEENTKVQLTSLLTNHSTSQLILIGPEGDFTPAEIALAKEFNFIPVALGNTRLRTETAGIFAAVILINS